MAVTTVVVTVLVTLIVVLAGLYVYQNYPVIMGRAAPVVHIPPLQKVGATKDEHGCCVDCGYEWCEAQQACVRPWEAPPGACVQ